jgi:leucyl aminopeptidase
MPSFTISDRPAVQAAADLLVVPVAARDGGGASKGGDASGDGGPVALPSTRAILEHADMDLAGLAALGQLTGALDETLLIPSYDRLAAPALLLVGVGPDQGRTLETLRRAASVAVAAAGRAGAVATTLADCAAAGRDGAPASHAETLAAVAEGFGLAAYRFDRHKTSADPVIGAVELLAGGRNGDGRDGDGRDGGGDRAGLEAALRRARVAVSATGYARDLSNEPAGSLGPAELTAEAARVAAEHGLEFESIEGEALTQGGFGAVAAVGAGASVPPRLVLLRYRPDGATARVGLVGKGVTFDTGGLCLKRGNSMAGMKDDMAGAATMLAVARAAAELELPVELRVALPLVENMPSGRAMRPGDVVRARNGTSIEITDTDAEGRLSLADGLALLAEWRPDALIDVATLTGSAVIGLGPLCTAVMGNAPALSAAVLTAAAATGEAAVALPLLDDYRHFLDSEVADLRNATEHPGDSIQAGLFLERFVDGVPWTHLDIAGPATLKEARYHQPKGSTGCMVRTLIELLDGAGRSGGFGPAGA